MNMKKILAVLAMMTLPIVAHATVRVVTTLPDLADFARQIGGDKVTVDHIVRGDQNPHFVEVKPSYMMKLKSADVFLMIGMELEMWAPQIIDGSRNARLDVVNLSKSIHKLEVPDKVDASQGDVHRYGNPHYWLDPRNIRAIVNEIVASLIKSSPADEQFFRTNAEAFLKKLDTKITEWEDAMRPLKGAKLITFHKSWSYFAAWLGLDVVDQVEPKPGIQPSPGHTAQLIQKVRAGNIKAIVVEPFYDASAPQQIARSTSATVLRLPTSVGGVDEARDYISMMDYNIRTLVEALK
ncbi:zinc ABC transporter substrate-binding protein [Sphingobacteriales bacterium CHB3]|nr:zinc ABC transporter substrate-binding protein [Sphingobacteriales bacterium CHB3]